MRELKYALILLVGVVVSCQRASTEPPTAEIDEGYVVFNVNAKVEYQNVVGFGGYLNCDWVGSENMLSVAEVERLYLPHEGLGYNIIRTRIYPQKQRWATHIAHLKKAQQCGATLLASAWSPPDDMVLYRDTPKHNGVKYVPAENYSRYAQHLKSYIDYMTANGVRIDVLSVQNEPDGDFCHWYPQELLAFIKEYGGKLGDAKIMVAEAVGFNRKYTDPILNDAQALANVDIIGGHIYGGGVFDYPLSRQKNRDVWMTEHLHNDQNSPEGVASLGWLPSLTCLGTEIHRCMEANFSTYLWWYLKRYYSMMGDDDARSPVESGVITKRGYILSHYAKYASNTRRISIESDSALEQPLATAYMADGQITLIIINEQIIPCKIKIILPDKIGEVSSVETTATRNMQPIATTISSDKMSVKVSLSRYSITSLRIRFK